MNVIQKSSPESRTALIQIRFFQIIKNTCDVDPLKIWQIYTKVPEFLCAVINHKKNIKPHHFTAHIKVWFINCLVGIGILERFFSRMLFLLGNEKGALGVEFAARHIVELPGRIARYFFKLSYKMGLVIILT